MRRRSDQEIEREKKRTIIKKFSTKYNKNVPEAILIKKFIKEKNEATLFGRVMAKRDMGKSFFIDLLDESGRVQLFVSTKIINDEARKNLELLDLGDFIAAKGTFMQTKTGQDSLRTKDFWIVTKSLNVLPDKFKGLKDEEDLIRKRYLDILMNEDRRKMFQMRTVGHNAIRKFLDSLSYNEVQTPSLITISNGALARPFKTHHNTLDIPMYMRIAPELNLKRLIAGNMGKVYEIARCFRNEGISNRHNPEFDMLEIYKANGSAKDMMRLCENIVRELCQVFWSSHKGEINGHMIDMGKPFVTESMLSLVSDKIGIDIESVPNDKAIELTNKLLPGKNVKKATNELLAFYIFEELIEKTIIEPTFVYGYPIEKSPLAKVNEKNENLTNRFEFFMAGVEVANGYDEQNDYFDQKKSFLYQQEQKKEGDDEAVDFDHEYLEMLRHGLPPTGGLGIGLDRMYMLLLNLSSIKDIILFPVTKTK